MNLTPSKKFSGLQIVQWTLITVLTAFAFFSSYKDYNSKTEWRSGVRITHINNYYIFTQAFHTLKEKGHLYKYHREVHYDYYKYSPTFALLMAPIALLPDFPGLLTWNYLNLFVFILGIFSLPGINRKSALIMLLLCSLELLGSIQNDQSNGLMAGLILLFLSFMEKGNSRLAILFLCLSVYIKLFSLVFFVLLLFYPNVIRNSIISLLWMSLLFILPAILSGFDYLLQSYKEWMVLLGSDHDSSWGYSLMGVLNSWFSLELNKILLVMIGLTLSLLPLINYKNLIARESRYVYTGLWLIWVVIFNHKAESPLFVIAMAGIVLWFFNSDQSKADKILLIASLVMVSLAFSDLVPLSLKENILYKYSLKAILPIIVWGKIIFDLTTKRLLNDTE